MDEKNIQALLRDQVLVDVTEMLLHPNTTGIQRVVKEFCVHWPGEVPLVPYMVRSETEIAILDPRALQKLVDYFQVSDADVVGAYAKETVRHGARIDSNYLELIDFGRNPLFVLDVYTIAGSVRAFVNMELFGEVHRARFYKRLAENACDKIFVLVHDFLLWLKPETFPDHSWRFGFGLLEYTNALSRLKHVAFTAGPNLEDFVKRINRRSLPTYRNVLLGCDSLGSAPVSDTFTPAKFVVLGTLEPRKQPLRILRAFRRLAESGEHFSLHFCGKLGWLSQEQTQEFMSALDDHEWLHWHENLTDRQLSAMLRGAAASIYYSRAEGFGLPPVESLALGVPVIVSDCTPSIANLPEKGITRVPADDETALERAVKDHCDVQFARGKRWEIDQSALMSWRQWGQSIGRWVLDETALSRGHATLSMIRTASLADRLAVAHEIACAQAEGNGVNIVRTFRMIHRRAPTGAELKHWEEICRTLQLPRHDLAVLLLVEAGRASKNLDYLYIASSIGGGDVAFPALLNWSRSDAHDQRIQTLARAALELTEKRGAVFLIESYRKLLGRSPGAAEMRQEIGLTALTGVWLRLNDLFRSPEFRHREDATVVKAIEHWAGVLAETALSVNEAEESEFIVALYNVALRRGPGPDELAEKLACLAGGQSRELVAIGVWLSGEAISHADDLKLLRFIIEWLASRLEQKGQGVARVGSGRLLLGLKTAAETFLSTSLQQDGQWLLAEAGEIIAEASRDRSALDRALALPKSVLEQDILKIRADHQPPITPLAVAALLKNQALYDLPETPEGWSTLSGWLFGACLAEYGFARLLSDAQWAWLHVRESSTPQDTPLPLLRHTKLLWNLRSDLQSAFDIQKLDGRRGLTRWYWLWGVVEYALVDALPADSLAQLEEVHPPIGDACDLSIAEVEIWHALPIDIQKQCPLNNNASISRYRTWLYGPGVQAFPIIKRLAQRLSSQPNRKLENVEAPSNTAKSVA